MSNLDFDFIRKAERVTSFNISTSDFQTLRHKKELQHLINKHFFPKFDLSKTLDRVDKNQLNNLIAELRNEDRAMFGKLHSYNIKGVGPGEATLFFLVNPAVLGGGSSAGVDVIVGAAKYEVKAVKLTPQRIATDFKLGGTVSLSHIIMQLDALRTSLKLGGSKTEISGSITDQMRVRAPDQFAAIEREYAALAADYFKGHDVIFVNNAAGPNIGKIEAITRVQADDVMIERVTSGTVKPKINLG